VCYPDSARRDQALLSRNIPPQFKGSHYGPDRRRAPIEWADDQLRPNPELAKALQDLHEAGILIPALRRPPWAFNLGDDVSILGNPRRDTWQATGGGTAACR